MVAKKGRLSRFVRFVVDLLSGVGKRRIWTYAAAAAFYLFLAIFPITTLICSLLPYTPLTQETLLNLMSGVLPSSVFELISGIVEDVYTASGATMSIAAVVSVWSASMSLVSLMRGLDAAYDRERRMNFLLLRFLACWFMVIMLAAILVTLCAIVYGQKILDLLQSKLVPSWAVDALFVIIRYGRYLVIMLFLYLVFLLLYKWMPIGKNKLKQQWRGAVFTTVAWLVFSWAFSFYLDKFGKYGVYGILGTVIVALMWIYYCMFFVLLGGYLNNYVLTKKLAEEQNPETERNPETEQKPTEVGDTETEKGETDNGSESVELRGDATLSGDT